MNSLTRPLVVSFTLRTAFLWVAVRAVFTAFTRTVDAIIPVTEVRPATLVDSIRPEPVTSVAIAAVVAMLVLSDVRAMRERAFLANLGVGLGQIARFAFGGALGLEIAAAVLFTVLA